MSHVKIWIHAVWSTKDRIRCLPADKLVPLCEHIKSNAAEKGVYIDTINGYDDHIHVLMLLKVDMSIARQMQMIKGESSHWVSATGLLPADFAWESQYYASSVSGRMVPAVRAYIKNQQAHHANVTFAAEFDHLLRSTGYEHDAPSEAELPRMIRSIENPGESSSP